MLRHLRLARFWLSVCVVLGLGVWPVSAQEAPTDTADKPADSVVQPADTVRPTDGDIESNGATLQSPDSSGQATATCSAAQTQAATTAVPGRPPRPTPKPGPGNTVVPLFCKPFSGEYSIFAFFDHDLPFVFNDFNGYQLTWWGLKVVPENADGHPGYDWILPEGTPVLAVAAGIVTAAGKSPPFRCPAPDGRETVDNTVNIEHQANTSSETLRVRSDYDHLSRIDAQLGQLVRPGDQIGLSGNPSCVGSPHLHFQTNLFVTGRFIQIDPYGWESPAPDPWAQDPRGAPSIWLWQDGQAPAISYREVEQPPNPRGPPGAPVAITYVRWLAAHDDQNPNNEFVELTLDPRYASAGTYDLGRYTLGNNRGDTFTFPDGFQIQQDVTARIYVGSGQNSPTELYWGRSSGVFDAMGDCLRLQRPNGATGYSVGIAAAACN